MFKKLFISEKAAKTLKSYKYQGSDASLLYKYIFSPLAQFIVDKIIPSWMAPNVITLIGFFCTLIPHIIIFAYFPNNLEGDVPAWMCFLAGIGQLLYLILDNADGKQARKTGTSSPLGLLFDHGCDAMNTFISGLSLFTVLQFGNTYLSLLGYCIAFTVFFAATWEEYYVEALNLPVFNGATEGVVGASLLFFISGIFGATSWNNKLMGTEFKVWVLIFFTIFSIITICYNLYNVYKKVPEGFLKAVSKLSVMGYLVLTMVIVEYLSVTNVVSRSARIFIYFIGFSFAKMVGILQATHCASEEFNPYRLSILIPATVLNLHTIIGYFLGRPLINEDLLIWSLAVFAFLAHLHFIWNIIAQFTEALNIYVFSIDRPPASGKAFTEISEEEVEFKASRE